MSNAATATAPVVEAPEILAKAIAAIGGMDFFPSVQDIAEKVVFLGLDVPEPQRGGHLCNKIATLIESGDLDDALRLAAQSRRLTIKRKAIHDKHGHVKAEDKLGRKGHRELRHGLILRDGKGFRVCGRTTKDLSDAQRDALYEMRKKHKMSWGKISNHPSLKLEYNHGMTARNIFLAVQRAKKS